MIDLDKVPAEHTVAIIRDDTIIYTGKTVDSRKQWDEYLLDSNHGIFTYAGRAIDGPWYRLNWAIK